MINYDDLSDWLDYGQKQGWITEPFCNTHDGDPYMTEEEEKEWEDGGDPCCHVVKFLGQY
jgi:hypothetical protein